MSGLDGLVGPDLDAVLADIAGKGGVLDNLASNPDPLGLSGALTDGSTLLGNVFGHSGVVEDLFSGHDQVGQVLADIVGEGGITGNLLSDSDGLGLGHLLHGETVLGNLLGNSGVVDDALHLLG